MADENKNKGAGLLGIGLESGMDRSVLSKAAAAMASVPDQLRNLHLADPLKGVGLDKATRNLEFLNNVDNRTRAEIREDYEAKLKEFDRASIEKLKKDIDSIVHNNDGVKVFWEMKSDVELALDKMIVHMDLYEQLNSENFRKVELKEKELKLDANYDWYAKFRLFFFRILASLLFVSTVFLIGYLEKNFEWAVLPMSKYINVEVPK